MVMAPREFLNGRIVLHPGDCVEVMRTLPDYSVDSVCTDPPYHLTSIVKRFGKQGSAPAQFGTDGAFARASRGFMGKQWDGGDIAFRSELWTEVLRVLKPGGYMLAFSSTRTFGRMQVAIEDAGFITHPFIAWVFATGFPKAHRVQAEGWEGFRYGGQALKPAIEPIYMGQKPFERGLTGTENVLAHGVGGLNIDGCRVPMNGEVVKTGQGTSDSIYGGGNGLRPAEMGTQQFESHALGRWPANLIHDGSDEVEEAFAAFGESKSSDNVRVNRVTTQYGFGDGQPEGRLSGGFIDSGTASRFFYAAKGDAVDRIGSRHPTIKPLDLIQYLVRLITPPGGTVLDLFAGTGTTGEAAFREGMRAILIEREEEYQADIARRMELAYANNRARKAAADQARNKPIKDRHTDTADMFR